MSYYVIVNGRADSHFMTLAGAMSRAERLSHVDRMFADCVPPRDIRIEPSHDLAAR